MTNAIQNVVVATFTSTSADENGMKLLGKLKKQTREEILIQNREFNGHFKSYKPPTILSTFLKLHLIGPDTTDTERTRNLDVAIQVVTQVVAQNVKSN